MRLHLLEERARPRSTAPGPGEEEVPAGARDPDVEQPSLLEGVGLGSARTEREFAVDHPRKEHGVELEPLRPVIGEQVHAAAAVRGGEPLGQLGQERRRAAIGMGSLELRGQGTHPRQVGLTRHLLVGIGRRLVVVPELVGDAHDGIGHGGVRGRSLQSPYDPPRSGSPQERAVADLIGDAHGRERFLERLGSSVDPRKDRDLLERYRLLAVQSSHRLHDGGDLGALIGLASGDRGRAGRSVRPEGLPDPAQPRRELVREREDLRRGPVVLLEPNHRRARESTREVQQVLGRRPRERVDRLVVVAHHAEVVAVAEPPVEQSRLQRIHVLELVHGEGGEPRSDGVGRIGMVVEESEGESEHVLEVQAPHRALPALVSLVDPEHQLRGDRRLVVAQLCQVAGGLDHPVLGPLDLAREFASREEPVRRGQRVRERGDEWSLGVQDVGERLARVRGPQTRELCQRRGMERARLHLVDLERAEPSLELTCRLVGECDGEDLRGLERSAHDLTGDPMRDGGRLPRPGAGQDRDRPAECERGLPLGLVQAGEHALEVGHPADPSIGPAAPGRDRDHSHDARLEVPPPGVCRSCGHRR